MTHVTCRLTAKNRDQLRNLIIGNQVWAPFTFIRVVSGAGSMKRSGVRPSVRLSVPTACGGFAAVGPACRKYRSIGRRRSSTARSSISGQRIATALLNAYLLIVCFAMSVNKATSAISNQIFYRFNANVCTYFNPQSLKSVY